MINIPKGTKDVLPADSYKWQHLESCARQVASLYNLQEIRTPTFEHTELFLRGVGDTTDIVNKEMYTFLDKGGRSITLKPEGTAGVARSFIENSLGGGTLPIKMYYLTPVFRYERPQAGRLREHHQFGVEVYGAQSACTDAEVISLASDFFAKLNISNLQLNINSIGCPTCRPAYNRLLRDYFAPHIDSMCQTCISRYQKNPLRILDCKEPHCISINKNAPKITDHLCSECDEHFTSLKEYLTLLGIEFVVNPYIVRGLDYYTKTVFEFISQNIGSQGTVCGGGRYDMLTENLGGQKTFCVGFGLGLERLLLLMENCNIQIEKPKTVDVYFATMGTLAHKLAYKLTKEARQANLKAEFDHLARGIKPQFKYADKLGAKFVVVIGENELQSGELAVKCLKTGQTQTVRAENLVSYLVNNNAI